MIRWERAAGVVVYGTGILMSLVGAWELDYG